MKRKALARLLVTLLLLPWLAGCWNKTEIEEGAYILALGIDKGEDLPYSVTVVMAKPAAIAGKEGGGGEEKPVVITTVEAPSIAGALSMLHGYVGRQVTLYHTKALFLHEEMARTGGLKVIDELLRFRQIRETVFFIVTREEAGQFLSDLKVDLEKDPMRFIEQMTYNYRRNAMLPADSQINHFASKLDVAYAQPLSYYAAVVDEEEKGEKETESAQAEAGFKAGQLPREGGANVEMLGAAAFRGQQMVGVLTGDEMRHLLMLQDKFRKALVAFKDPKNPELYVSVELSLGRPFQPQADLSGTRPRLFGTISLEAEILGIQSGTDYSEPELQGLLERAMAEQIQQQIIELVSKTQEWETDIVGFGRHLVSLFPTVAEWEAYDWLAKYPDAQFSIDVKLKLRRFGLTLSPVESDE